MTDYTALSAHEIKQGVKETIASMQRIEEYQAMLATQGGLPVDQQARERLAESNEKMLAKLEDDLDKLMRAYPGEG